MPTLEKITKSPDKCPGDGSNNDGDDTAMTDDHAVAAETVASSSTAAINSNNNEQNNSIEGSADDEQPHHTTPTTPAAANINNINNNNNNDNMTHHPPTTTSPYTRVDGKGLWRSWKRNFKNKLLALLDLIDNSLDAAIVNTVVDTTNNNKNKDTEEDDFVGRVHIYPDDVECTTRTSDEDRLTPEVTLSSTTTTTQRPQQLQTTTSSSSSTTAARTIRKCTGLCIINNSYKPIRTMEEVLGVYNSSKVNSGAGDIGENGVGLKQGCKFCFVLCFFFGFIYCIELGWK